jgi:hypothetical protein
MQMVDQGEQQSLEQSESLSDVHPAVVDPEDQLSDAEMFYHSEQQIVEHSGMPALDVVMVD